MKRSLAACLFISALLVGAVLRFLNLSKTGWQYDEIVYRLVATNLLQHGQLVEKAYYGQPQSAFLYQPPWYPHLLAGWFWLTHPTVYDARVLGVIFSLGTLTLTWLLVRRLAGDQVALFAVVPLVFDGWLLYVQRVSYIENLLLLAIVAGLLLYQRALDRPSWQRFLSAGLVLGAAGCLKYTGVYVLIGLALSWLIVRRQHAGHGIALGSAIGLLGLDQVYLVLRYGSAYTSETAVQIRRVLGLQKSGGSTNSPAKLLHLLFAQYDIFIPSFLIAVGGLVLLVTWLLRCYRARSWEPVQDNALLFSWAAAGVLVFGLSSIRYPQYFALILVPLYLIFWVTIWKNPRPLLKYGIFGVAVIAGVVSYHVSTERQAVNPFTHVQQYMAANVPASAVTVADEQVGDLIKQPYCREQDATPCLHHATYAVTWDTYLQQTQKLGDKAFAEEFAGATKLYSSKGFSGTATVWKLNSAASKPAPPVVGVDVYASHRYSKPEAAAHGKLVLRYIHSTLHGDAVGIVWNLCGSNFRTGGVRACAESLSPSDVDILIREAKADHLAVQLRPLIRVGPPSGWNDPARSWEGNIRPVSSQSFAESLLAAEKPYLTVARQEHVSQFVVGSELVGWQGTSWQSWLLSKAKQVCDCKVSFAYTQTGQLPTAGAEGLDYYPSVKLPDDASQARVTARVERQLASIPASERQNLTLDEISIAAEDGAYAHPANWNADKPVNRTIQVRWFTGMCEAAERYHLAGLYFYEVPLNDSISHPDSFPAFFVGTRSAKAIRTCELRLSGYLPSYALLRVFCQESMAISCRQPLL